MSDDLILRSNAIAEKIDHGTASYDELIEWLSSTIGKDPRSERAIALLKDALSSGYGDAWFDGFMKAKELTLSGVDVTDYNEMAIIEMSEHAESDHAESLSK